MLYAFIYYIGTLAYDVLSCLFSAYRHILLTIHIIARLNSTTDNSKQIVAHATECFRYKIQETKNVGVVYIYILYTQQYIL